MRIKTSELEGAALDWAVSMAICPESFKTDQKDANGLYPWSTGWLRKGSPSTDWSQVGPLIERYGMWLSNDSERPEPWIGSIGGLHMQFGPTPLIALCRAIVAMKLGHEVDIPEELRND